MRIKKGDNIIVITGKDKGKTGKITLMAKDKSKVTIEGINMYKKHKRPVKQGEKGQIVSVPRPMNISNVLLVCGNCKKGARFGINTEGGNKNLFCKKCKSVR